MKAYACPRCLTLSSETEDGDGGNHACTPTPLVRGLEAYVAELEAQQKCDIESIHAIQTEKDRYRAALSEMSDELSHYPEENGVWGRLKQILRRAITA